MSEQIKLIYKIIISEKTHWNIHVIGKHWLKKFDIEYNESLFLCKCSNIKGLNISDMPHFYQSSIRSWAIFKSKMKLHDKEHILGENLFGNINISVRNTPLFYSDFCRGNIITIKDIWNVDNDVFYTEQYIQNKTAAIPNWRQKYRKLKDNIPEGWINILKTNNAPTQTKPKFHLSSELLLYRNDKFITPNKLSLKLINSNLTDETYKPKCETKREVLFNQNFNWKSIWESTKETLCSNKEKHNFSGKSSITQFSLNINFN